MATKSETASPDSRSSTPSPVNEKKRPREDTDTQHQEHPTTSTSPPGTPPAVRTDRAVSVDDLLIPLAEPDWTGFASKLQTKLDDVRAEESRLTEEYHKWCWLFEHWYNSGAEGEHLRLLQEAATVARWSQIKGDELEENRIAHAGDMNKISSVLGIFTGGPSATPGA